MEDKEFNALADAALARIEVALEAMRGGYRF